MDPVFAFIEHTELSEWIRGSESMFAFPAIITLHAIGMAFLAGGSAAIDLRILGFAQNLSLAAMERFLPVLWLGFAINAVSGTLLLIAYPTKAFTNPVFYVKLGLIALGVGLVYRIGTTVLCGPNVEEKPDKHARTLAVASLAVWVALITAGRLLGYTHTWILQGVKANF